MKKHIVFGAIVLLGVAVLMFFCGCAATHNLTTLEAKEVYSRTSEASTAKLDPEGNMAASYHGLGPTQLMQDAKGNWTNMPGPVGVLSVPMPEGGVGYIISPKDTKIAKLSYTPKPKDGEASIVVEGLEANISVPEAQQVAALTVALPVLQSMTREEALAMVEKWKVAGTITEKLADTLVPLITALWPAGIVTP